mmetsp:Transcript_26642/g.47290  ORF Transcript_26642/g.47290 Transcript_26642/m.47290 type:complete len:101 (-) Transcript_26642:1013-1315(-)
MLAAALWKSQVATRRSYGLRLRVGKQVVRGCLWKKLRKRILGILTTRSYCLRLLVEKPSSNKTTRTRTTTTTTTSTKTTDNNHGDDDDNNDNTHHHNHRQ